MNLTAGDYFIEIDKGNSRAADNLVERERGREKEGEKEPHKRR